MYTKCTCSGNPPCDAPNTSGGPVCDNCKNCCGHHDAAEPHCPRCYEALEDRIFKIKQIGDRLFMHANMLPISARTTELDDAIMAWADVHKGNI